MNRVGLYRGVHGRRMCVIRFSVMNRSGWLERIGMGGLDGDIVAIISDRSGEAALASIPIPGKHGDGRQGSQA